MEKELKDIILVDDHVVIRDGLKELIQKFGPYKVSRVYDNGADFVADLPLQPVPDLIIMDITMPEMDGDEVMAVLKERGYKYPVMILTLNHDENRIIRLFRLGVRGYLEKNCTAAILKQSLEEIFRVGYYHNDMLAFALMSEQKTEKSPRDQILEQLTEKELRFMRFVCDEEEYTYDQIADMMGMVRRTVDGYRQTIFEKFGIKSKTGLVLFAIRHNLFDYLTTKDQTPG